jgi:threonylcarbamoyladenosine tRNA methylthiotransferase MtaB
LSSSFSIENFGCRATLADAAAIERGLLDVGLARVDQHRHADFVVLNTCTVTASADAQARDAIRHIRAANPAARILVTGCYAQRAPEELAALAGVEWVVGNSHQTEIPAVLWASLKHCDSRRPEGISSEESGALEIAETAHGTPRPSPDFVPLQSLGSNNSGTSPSRRPAAQILSGDIYQQDTIPVAPVERTAAERTRPTLKIQDGCNNRCSYCIIPSVRGKNRSLPPNHVIDEIERLVAAGAKEIVLSGINLGTYGRDLQPRVSLLAVLRRVLAETRLDRLRLSSIEPMDVTRDFVEWIAAEPRVAPHFHMPLQSGSDRILRAMHRWYRAAHYERRIEVIRECLPDAAIGADVIAGFPGESDDDFRETEEFIARLPFTYLHVFSFSARPGTPAASLAGQVPPSTVRARARRLRDLAARKTADFRRSQAGRTLRALTLRQKKDGFGEAITGNFLHVPIAEPHPANTWLDIRLDAESL